MKPKFNILKLLYIACFLINGIIFIRNANGQNYNDTLEYPYQYIGNSYCNWDSIVEFPDQIYSTEEYLEETIWMPGVPGGVIPYDIIFVGESVNKIFIYGDRKIIVMDASSHEIIQELYLSDYGSGSLGKHRSIFSSKEKHFAWSPDIDMIYCVNDNMQLYLIDPSSMSLIPLPDQETGMSKFDYTIIKYNDLTNQLFWLIGREYNFSKLLVFSTEGQIITYQYEINFQRPFDIEFHPVEPIFFISDGPNLFKYNCLDHELLDLYESEFRLGEIIIAYDSEFEVDKIYCLPNTLNENLTGDPYALIIEGSVASELELTRSYYTSGYYNPTNNIVFFGYSHDHPNGAGITLYRADEENTLLSDYEFEGFKGPFDIVADFISIGVKTVVSTKDQIIFCNNQFVLTDYIYDEEQEAHFYRLAASDDNQVFVTNTQGSAINVFSTVTYSLLNKIYTGNASYHGFFNYMSDKLYLWNFHDKGNRELVIYNNATHEIQFLDIGYLPGGIAWDKASNKIYLSNEDSQEIRIKILDCNTDEFDDQGFTITTFNRCTGLFWAPGNHLYICAESGWDNHNPCILIYDLDQNEIHKIIGLYNSQVGNGHDPHFLYDIQTNRVFISVKEWGEDNGNIVEIENDHGQNFPHITFPLLPNVDKIRYNHFNNSLIIKQFNLSSNPYAQYNSIYILDLNTGNPVSIPVKEDCFICDIEFDSNRNHIYCTFRDYENSRYIDKLDGNSGDLIEEIRSSGQVNSLLFNPVNRKLYIHMVLNNSIADRLKEELLSYDPDLNELKYIYLDQKESPRSAISSYITDIILDELENEIYLSNAQSNIKVVQCAADQLILQPNIWNWISFPRLVRPYNDPNVDNEVFAQPILTNIVPFPTTMTMTNLPLQTPPGGEISIHYNNELIPPWYGQLTYIKSTLGYKLETNNTEVSFLPLQGTRLNPAYFQDIFEGYTNWVGYYPTWSQEPLDALADVLDELTIIRHHDWACVKDWIYYDGNLVPIWVCSRTKPLKYGDMVELETAEDVSFQWNGSSSEYHDLPHPEYYTYEEKPDYIPIFIELDTTGNAMEIGAFVADTCIGATVVEEGDSLAMIRAYLPDDTSGTITFQQYYGSTKRTGDRIEEYFVKNATTHIKEKRAIHSKENKKYYFVSFKNEGKDHESIDQIMLNILPNPSAGLCKIEYFIPSTSDVIFEVFDIYGRKLFSRLEEDKPAGKYYMPENNFPNEKLHSGIYIVRLTACGSSLTKKILITR